MNKRLTRKWPIILPFFFSFVALFFSSRASAQLSDLHYLPPLKQKSGVDANFIYLTTPSSDTMIVDVYKGALTTVAWTYTISNSSDATFSPGSMASSLDNNVTFMKDDSTGVVVTTAGLRFQSRSGEKFYVTSRAKDGTTQATSLTSKGRAALGTAFKWVGAPNRGSSTTLLDNSVGIMATENGTTVQIYGYHTACTFRQGASAAGFTADQLSISLNKGQTFVLEAPIEVQNNINASGWIGANIKSNKNIAVSVGQIHYQPTFIVAGNQDIAMDQIVPTTAIGKEYVFVRGNGSDSTEFPILIATENDTKIYVKGQTTPIATINDGQWYKIPPANYSQAFSGTSIPGANMFVTTSKPVYAMQSLAGDELITTVDLNFVPPVNCLMGNKVNYIPDNTDMAGLAITGAVSIITAANITGV